MNKLTIYNSLEGLKNICVHTPSFSSSHLLVSHAAHPPHCHPYLVVCLDVSSGYNKIKEYTFCFTLKLCIAIQ